VIHDLFYTFGAAAAAFKDGLDMPRLAETRAAARAVRASRVRGILGQPRLQPATRPWAEWKVTELRAELTRRKIAGRSKARTKAAMIALLSGPVRR
jgi:hypothetical protein